MKELFKITENKVIITVILSVSFLILSLILAVYSITERLPDDYSGKLEQSIAQTFIGILNPATIIIARIVY